MSNSVKIEYMLTKCEECEKTTPLGRYCAFCGKALPRPRMELQYTQCHLCSKTIPLIGQYCVSCGGVLHE